MPIDRHCLALSVGLLGGLVWTGPALAGGFATARFGGEHGNPITSNPTAIYYNPAGIAESEGIHLFLDGNLAIRAASYTHALVASDDATVPEANAGEASLLNLAASPMLGVSARLGDVALGAGVYVPFGGAASWDRNEAYAGGGELAGPVDGVQRWHSIESSLQAMFFSVAAAYKIPAIRLSVGASGNLIRTEVSTVRARNAAGDNLLATEGRSLLEVSGLHASFGVGALLEAMPRRLWIGASYQSRPNVTGGETLEGTLTNRFNGVSSAPDDVALHQGLPDIVRLGARFVPADGVEVRLFGDWTRWSSMENQCLTEVGAACEINEDGSATDDAGVVQNIARRWNDTFGVRAGVSYWPRPAIELFGGLGYDSNAVPEETLDPSATDFHDVSVAVGGRFQLAERLHLAASYTHLFYVSRDTTGQSISAGLAGKSRAPDSGGIYAQTIGVLNLNLDIPF
ncbi:outer membrane protein transport protein [Sorangium sp. So ce1036]|uniref:OmpP1/FadL family transporter n=1 Tax=Sorangium sp. So ce1036 TaxID=3133328 RepID=UPI003F089EAA